MTDRNALATLRTEVDGIDDTLLDLIERRLAASQAIAEAKGGSRDGLLKLCPRRQAEIVARLQARAVRIPADAIALIWRELMAHTLQAQERTEILLCAPGAPPSLETRIRDRFGEAFPIRWIADREQALRGARESEAIAVLAEPLAAGEAGPLIVFDVIRGADGEALAYAAGRVAPEDVLADAAAVAPGPRSDSSRPRCGAA